MSILEIAYWGTVYLAGRVQEAEEVIVRLHRDKADPTDSYAHDEFMHIKAQLDLEAEASQSIWKGLKDPHMRKRFIVGWLGTTASQSSGSIVILSKSTELESSLARDFVPELLMNCSLFIGDLWKAGIQPFPSRSIDWGLDRSPHALQFPWWHPY
jgi:hypothetical protein